jgi:hypothetical protein
MDFFLPTFGDWSDEELERHKEQLPDMRSMVLYGRGITDRGMKLLSRCRKLKELHLVNTSITDAGLGYVSCLQTLDWLVIDEAETTDSGLSELKALSNLIGLQVVSTRAADKGFKSLLHCPRLAYLEAAGLHINDSSVSAIARLPALKMLRLASPQATDLAFLDLSACASLTDLTYDLPLVTQGAVNAMMAHRPTFVLRRYDQFRIEDRIIGLVRSLLRKENSEEQSIQGILATNELLQINPLNPVVHGTKGILNLSVGRFDESRQNFAVAKKYARYTGDNQLVDLAATCVQAQNARELQDLLEHSQLNKLLATRLLTSPSNNLLKLQTLVSYQKKARREALVEYETPSYIFPEINGSNDYGGIWIPTKNREIIAVPWQW